MDSAAKLKDLKTTRKSYYDWKCHNEQTISFADIAARKVIMKHSAGKSIQN